MDGKDTASGEAQKQTYEETVQDVEKGLRAPEKAHLPSS